MQGRPGFAWEGGGKHAAWALPPAAAGAWRITGGFTCLSPCPLAAWMAGIIWSAGRCGAVGCDLQFPLVSPSRCSRGISHGHAANAPGVPSLLGTQLRFSLLSLLCLLPWHEPCGSSGSHPCLRTTGGLRCPGDVGNSCWEGPIFCSSTRRAWGGLPYLAFLCKASPAVLAALP